MEMASETCLNKWLCVQQIKHVHSNFVAYNSGVCILRLQSVGKCVYFIFGKIHQHTESEIRDKKCWACNLVHQFKLNFPITHLISVILAEYQTAGENAQTGFQHFNRLGPAETMSIFRIRLLPFQQRIF